MWHSATEDPSSLVAVEDPPTTVTPGDKGDVLSVLYLRPWMSGL